MGFKGNQRKRIESVKPELPSDRGRVEVDLGVPQDFC